MGKTIPIKQRRINKVARNVYDLIVATEREADPPDWEELEDEDEDKEAAFAIATALVNIVDALVYDGA